MTQKAIVLFAFVLLGMFSFEMIYINANPVIIYNYQLELVANADKYLQENTNLKILSVHSENSDNSEYFENLNDVEHTEIMADNNIDDISFSNVEDKQFTKLYHFGKRAPGDRISGHAGATFHYPSAKSVNLAFTYPRKGYPGYTVTYCTVNVTQDSPFTNANIIEGGIGQKTITVGIEAKNITFIHLDAVVYARK